MYKVIKAFVHTADNNYSYSVGDEFPRTGLEASDELCKELAGVTALRPYPLLQEIKDKPVKRNSKKKE